MTVTRIQATHPVDAGTLPGSDNPPQWPQPPAAPQYDPYHLMADTYLRLHLADVLPAGAGMPDLPGAVRACADLLRAFGVEPVEVSPTAAPEDVAWAVAA